MAPILDSGSSLGYDKTASQIRMERDVVCKPFKKHHVEQLKLVSSFDWINFDTFTDIGVLVQEVLSSNQAKDFVGNERAEAIVETAEKRLSTLQDMAVNQRSSAISDSMEDDVEENIAEDYAPRLTL